jgi:AraC-like DNA-binding protein
MLDQLTDPLLNPRRIAQAHCISVRHLHKLCHRAGFSPEQWIISQRLERARAELARPDHRKPSISTIATRCGFRDPAHFARRFRAAYGMTPTEWRRLALDARAMPPR